MTAFGTVIIRQRLERQAETGMPFTAYSRVCERHVAAAEAVAVAGRVTELIHSTQWTGSCCKR